jgi:hypothetical protein
MACTALTPPANAYSDYSGNTWACADGFHRQAESASRIDRNNMESPHQAWREFATD